MNLVYLVFGNQLTIHQQAIFSILTALKNGGNFNKIIVITDAPKYYKPIETNQLEIELISEKTLKNWKGEYNYIFRTKIKALEWIINKYPNDALFYLDSDTFVLNTLNDIKNKLSEGYFALHLNEGMLSKSTRKTQKKLWKAIKNQVISGIEIKPNLCMWNAGVIGIPMQNNKAYISQVLAVSDEIISFKKIKKRLVEQLSFSIVAQQQEKCIETDKEIVHYWGNKEEWNIKISNFLLNNQLKKYTFKGIIQKIENFNLLEFQAVVKRSNAVSRLKKIINKMLNVR